MFLRIRTARFRIRPKIRLTRGTSRPVPQFSVLIDTHKSQTSIAALRPGATKLPDASRCRSLNFTGVALNTKWETRFHDLRKIVLQAMKT